MVGASWSHGIVVVKEASWLSKLLLNDEASLLTTSLGKEIYLTNILTKCSSHPQGASKLKYLAKYLAK